MSVLFELGVVVVSVPLLESLPALALESYGCGCTAGPWPVREWPPREGVPVPALGNIPRVEVVDVDGVSCLARILFSALFLSRMSCCRLLTRKELAMIVGNTRERERAVRSHIFYGGCYFYENTTFMSINRSFIQRYLAEQIAKNGFLKSSECHILHSLGHVRVLRQVAAVRYRLFPHGRKLW